MRLYECWQIICYEVLKETEMFTRSLVETSGRNSGERRHRVPDSHSQGTPTLCSSPADEYERGVLMPKTGNIFGRWSLTLGAWQSLPRRLAIK